MKIASRLLVIAFAAMMVLGFVACSDDPVVSNGVLSFETWKYSPAGKSYTGKKLKAEYSESSVGVVFKWTKDGTDYEASNWNEIIPTEAGVYKIAVTNAIDENGDPVVIEKSITVDAAPAYIGYFGEYGGTVTAATEEYYEVVTITPEKFLMHGEDYGKGSTPDSLEYRITSWTEIADLTTITGKPSDQTWEKGYKLVGSVTSWTDGYKNSTKTGNNVAAGTDTWFNVVFSSDAQTMCLRTPLEGMGASTEDDGTARTYTVDNNDRAW